MDEKGERYHSYMLRLWLANSTGTCWLASLEDPLTGERKAFADIEALFAYLREVTARPAQLETQEEI